MNCTPGSLRHIGPALFVALLLAGCASAGGSSGVRADRCKGQPLDPMFSQGRTIFRACEVDRPARMTGSPASAMGQSSMMDRSTGCSRVELEFIVDERGIPQADRVRTVRSTSTDLLEQMQRAVPNLRYHPALKDGHPVPQLVSFTMIRSTVVAVVRAGASPSLPPTRAPNC